MEFLKELQREMKTQETDGQAAPRFWGIMEERERVTGEGYGGGTCIIDSTGGDTETYSLEEYVKDIEVEIEENFTPDGDLALEWKRVTKTDMDEVVDFARDWLDREAGACEIETHRQVSDRTGCFLTKRAAEKHIELNGYHYQNPHTYAMTAWRNPEFERFIRIFENLDLDKLENLTD